MNFDVNEAEVAHNEPEHRFEIRLGAYVAVVDYRRVGNRIAFLHTEVPEPLEGRGLAAKLAKTALDYAREHQLKVLPYCPYIATYIKRHPEYQSLVAESM